MWLNAYKHTTENSFPFFSELLIFRISSEATQQVSDQKKQQKGRA